MELLCYFKLLHPHRPHFRKGNRFDNVVPTEDRLDMVDLWTSVGSKLSDNLLNNVRQAYHGKKDAYPPAVLIKPPLTKHIRSCEYIVSSNIAPFANNSTAAKVTPTYLGFLIFGYSYMLIILYDTLAQQNTIQIIGLCMYSVTLMIYGIFQ